MYIFLFFILRRCKFPIYKFTNSSMNIIHALITLYILMILLEFHWHIAELT